MNEAIPQLQYSNDKLTMLLRTLDQRQNNLTYVPSQNRLYPKELRIKTSYLKAPMDVAWSYHAPTGTNARAQFPAVYFF